MAETKERKKTRSVSDYYSAVQLRSDRWSALRQIADEIVRLMEAEAVVNPKWMAFAS